MYEKFTIFTYHTYFMVALTPKLTCIMCFVLKMCIICTKKDHFYFMAIPKQRGRARARGPDANRFNKAMIFNILSWEVIEVLRN